jgi:hypothetical protein
MTKDINKMFLEFQNKILIQKLEKYKEENTELKAVIIKFASRIVELEKLINTENKQNNTYL